MAFTILLLSSESVNSVPDCASDRPGLADNRTLKVPKNMDMKGKAIDRMVNSLCCIYTHVEIETSDVNDFSLVLFDNSKETHQANSFKDAYNSVQSSICQMSMGFVDCEKQATCIEKAMKKKSLDDKFEKVIMSICTVADVKKKKILNTRRKCIKWCHKDPACQGLEIVSTDEKNFECSKYYTKPTPLPVIWGGVKDGNVVCYMRK